MHFLVSLRLCGTVVRSADQPPRTVLRCRIVVRSAERTGERAGEMKLFVELKGLVC